MRSETVEIPAPEGTANAYLARPDDGPFPGVLFIMDAFGLRPAVEQMVDRIAGDGYVVVAPNVFYRGGPNPVSPPEDPANRSEYFGSVIRPLIEQLTPERLAADGKAYLDYLAGAGATEPVAITGYCVGGRVGWWVAKAQAERVAALAGFHVGGLVSDDPDSPHLAAPHVEAETYWGFADEDPSMTAEQIHTFEMALSDAGLPHRIEVYEGANHGYTMVDSPVYDEAAAERHFRELRTLLERTLR